MSDVSAALAEDRDLLLMQLSAMDAEVDRLRAENDRLREVMPM